MTHFYDYYDFMGKGDKGQPICVSPKKGLWIARNSSKNVLTRTRFIGPEQTSSFVMLFLPPCVIMQTPFLEALRPLHGQIKLRVQASKSSPASKPETIQLNAQKYTFLKLNRYPSGQCSRTKIAKKRICPQLPLIYKFINIHCNPSLASDRI